MSRSRESRPRGSREQQDKNNNLRRTRATFIQISSNHHGALGFALLPHSLLIETAVQNGLNARPYESRSKIRDFTNVRSLVDMA